MATTNGKSAEELEIRRLALGLTLYLKRFAGRHRALRWSQLATGDHVNWKYYVLVALNDPEMEIFFNLQGVHVGVGLLRAASGGGSSTDWELLMIYQNPEWWPRIRWFDGNSPSSNPFDIQE